jgi:hypothetical protein
MPAITLNVDYFEVYRSPKQRYLLVVVTPDFDELVDQPDPQYLFCIDVETLDVKEVHCPFVPILNFAVSSNNRFYCQTAESITECVLK